MTDIPTPATDQTRPASQCAFARNGKTTCRVTDRCATCDGWPSTTGDEQPRRPGHALEQP